MLFDSIFRDAMPEHCKLQCRSEGPAFLNVAKNLYGFSRIDYLALNIPVSGWKKFMHCRHANDSIAQAMTKDSLAHEMISALNWNALKQGECQSISAWNGAVQLDANEDGIVFALRALHGEIVVSAVTWLKGEEDSEAKQSIAARDLRVLMNYFHSQLLRINGVDSESEILMSARELDCLSWTAAGKTAWEASVILGISERTVRFHLNVAREKLKCTTTTQAVAKAISHQLIDISA